MLVLLLCQCFVVLVAGVGGSCVEQAGGGFSMGVRRETGSVGAGRGAGVGG